MDLFNDIIKSINTKSGNAFDSSPEEISKYVPFVVNKNFSMGLDTILQANEMNKSPNLPPQLQYDFLYNSISKGKRFHKWAKADKQMDVDIICEYYECSSRVAREYAKILTDDQLDHIRKKIHKDEPENEHIRG